MKKSTMKTMGYVAATFGAAAILAAMNLTTCAAPTDSPAPTKPADAKAPGKSVDLRPFLKQWRLEPRVQGNRSTCSIFTMAEAMEYALASKQNCGTRLSVEFLNWAGNQTGKENPDGACFSELWTAYLAHGNCTEAEMPYREAFDTAYVPSKEAIAHAKELCAAGLQLHWIKEWDPRDGVNDRQLDEIKRTLDRGWPVCGGFLWPKSKTWENNLMQVIPFNRVIDGHSVLLVGYREDETQPGGGIFLFRNTAGDKRDCMMTFDYAVNFMNDAVWIDYAGAGQGGPAGKTPETMPGLADATGPAASPDALFRDPLGALCAPPVGRNRRVSSNQQPNWHDGNMDMSWVQPGESIEVPLLEGPGYINHIWFTSHSGWANELNSLTLRIYWDGRKEPGIEVPLADFFAVGQGKPAVVESLPVQVSPTGSLSCFWRMPFAKSAKIVITNDNPDRGTGLYWQIDWVKVDQLPPETAYFHAKYRQEYPAVPGRDYLIADLAGRGHFVGAVMSVTLAQDGWFGEGDDFFYIDGEAVASLQGTGSEDYFNDAWGFRPRSSHWFGTPRYQGDSAGDSFVAYRWHVLDPVRFDKSLRVEIEHKGNDNMDLEAWYLERPDFYSSVAFWYQVGEPKAFGQLPPWHERRMPWQQQHFVRAFLKAKTTGPTKVEVQTLGFFGSRPLLSWPNSTKGETLTLPFAVAEDGRHAVRLTAMQGPGLGRCAILIDGKQVAVADFSAKEEDELDLLLGTLELSKGDHEIAFIALETPVLGGKPEVKPLAVEMLRLLKLPPKAVREVKTHNEAHFVRLGIGRALYAYRLAYGKLPDSLEELVKVGIMPERYLRDENNRPLKATRDGDTMNVESTAPNGWKHRWQGLDARR